MSTGTTVGMIGTGTMGAAMTKALLEAGHTVVVHDARREAAASLLDAGARWATTRCDWAARSSVSRRIPKASACISKTDAASPETS